MWFVVTHTGIVLHVSKEYSYYASVYMHACRDTFVTSAFKEYWGEPELIILIVTIT